MSNNEQLSGERENENRVICKVGEPVILKGGHKEIKLFTHYISEEQIQAEMLRINNDDREIKVLTGSKPTSYHNDRRIYTTKATNNKVYEYYEGGANGRWLAENELLERRGDYIFEIDDEPQVESTPTRIQGLRSTIRS